MKGRIKFFVVAILILCMGLFGAQALLAKDITIGLSLATLFNITGQDILKAAKETSKAHDVDLIVTNAQGDVGKQIADIETLIERKVDALCVFALSPDAMKPVLEKANKRGIKTVSLDSRLMADGVVADVTSNNLMMGMMRAEWMERKASGFHGELWSGSHAYKELRRKGEKIDVVMFTVPSYDACRIREEGSRRAFESNPNINILESHAIVKVEAGMEEGRSKTQALLLKYPRKGQIDMIWCAYDHPAMGASEALSAAGREDIFVTGCDCGELITFNYIMKNKPACGSTAQKPYLWGKNGIELAVKYAKGEPVSRWYYCETEMITPDNVHPYAYGRWPEKYVKGVKKHDIKLPSNAVAWLKPEDKYLLKY